MPTNDPANHLKDEKSQRLTVQAKTTKSSPLSHFLFLWIHNGQTLKAPPIMSNITITPAHVIKLAMAKVPMLAEDGRESSIHCFFIIAAVVLSFLICKSLTSCLMISSVVRF